MDMTALRRHVRLRGLGGMRIRRAEPAAPRQALDYLDGFARTRPGVEAFVEPRTAVLGPTMVLVAATGEWTRRPIGGPRAARAFTGKRNIPLYDAELVGYPSRMRAWDATR